MKTTRKQQRCLACSLGRGRRAWEFMSLADTDSTGHELSVISYFRADESIFRTHCPLTLVSAHSGHRWARSSHSLGMSENPACQAPGGSSPSTSCFWVLPRYPGLHAQRTGASKPCVLLRGWRRASLVSQPSLRGDARSLELALPPGATELVSSLRTQCRVLAKLGPASSPGCLPHLPRA